MANRAPAHHDEGWGREWEVLIATVVGVIIVAAVLILLFG